MAEVATKDSVADKFKKKLKQHMKDRQAVGAEQKPPRNPVTQTIMQRLGFGAARAPSTTTAPPVPTAPTAPTNKGGELVKRRTVDDIRTGRMRSTELPPLTRQSKTPTPDRRAYEPTRVVKSASMKSTDVPPPPPPPPRHAARSPAPFTKLQATQNSTERAGADLLKYYHGWLPREDVDGMLKRKGHFLVRLTDAEGERQRVVISVRWSGVVRHFVIQQNEHKQFFVDERKFDSIQGLVEAYRTMRTPLTSGGGGAGTDAAAGSQPLLLHPVERKEWQLTHKQVERRNKLGDGAYGEVFRARLLHSNGTVTEDVAVKIQRGVTGAMTREERLKFLEEARLMREWDHPNITRLHGVAAQQEPFMIVLEFAPNGSLLDHLRGCGESLSLLQHVRYCVDAACGMRFLENKGCIHRDVATRNCLLGADYTVKIADFGLTCRDDRFEGAITDRMPIKWLAPESLDSREYTTKTDVWSFGVLLWEVFSDGRNPYPGMTNQHVRDAIGNKGTYRMTPPLCTPPDVAALMQLCWLLEPTLRPKFSVIYKSLNRLSSSL